MQIEELIGKLLLRTNCVIIPDFGGFIANTKSAHIDYSKGVVYPPTKSITFNRNLTNNDGLLVNEFGKINQLNYSDSLLEVTLFVKQTKDRLKKGERVSFDNIGFLYTADNGSLRFEQDRFFNLLLEAYGMGSVQFVPEAELEGEKNTTTEIPLKEQEQTPIITLIPATKTRTLAKIAKYAAAAALLPVLFYSFWIPTHTDVLRSGILFKDDFNPLKESSEAIYSKKELVDTSIDTIEDDGITFSEVINQLPENVSVFSFELNEDTFIPVKLETTASADPEIKNTTTSAKLRYHLIAGCFSHKSNADKLVKDLSDKGLNAYIVDFHNGLHRVSADQSTDSKSLESTRSTLSLSGFSSWVLKK
jgi:hypothetical protein